MSEKPSFFSELKRRNVYKVAVAYAVVGWLLVQVTTQVFPIFEIPNWAMRLIVLAIVIGFPIALVIAWAFELTPQGLKRTEDVDLAAPSPTKSHTWIYVVVIGAVLSIGLFLLGRYSAINLAPRQDASAARTEATTAIPQKSIAVLPFENLSDDKQNSYFADGIQDEILTKLGSIAELKVISRTSTAKYKSKPEDLKIVAQQLGVATVLEGTVQRSGDKVRVNVQLIDARSDSHLWAKSYDGDAKDIFGVESQVSQQVADALRAKLSPEEAKTLAKAPTQNPDAYDLFLRAEAQTRAAQATLTEEAYDRAAGLYAEALQRDQNFALAAARMAQARLWEHWFVAQLDATQLRQVRATIDHALSLAPDLAAGHVALGSFYYYTARDYDNAMAEYSRAIQLQPNDVVALQFRGYIYRRQGKWEESTAELNRAAELDPRDASLVENIAITHLHLRQWSDAKRAASRSLALEPQTSVLAQRALILANINGDGDVNAAARVVKEMEPGRRLRVNEVTGTVASIIGEATYVAVLQRDFDAAFRSWEADSSEQSQHRERLAARTALGVIAGSAASRTDEAEEARTLLEARLSERPNDRRAMMQLSWVYLALGRRPDAIRMAEAAARSLPVENDHVSGTIVATGLAEIEARVGDRNRAIAAVRDLLAIPAGQSMSIQRLKLDPVWDPIRNDPGFQQLLTMKEHVGP
jgi:TolB-like protein/Tfp pilus assembly protein PilF